MGQPPRVPQTRREIAPPSPGGRSTEPAALHPVPSPQLAPHQPAATQWCLPHADAGGPEPSTTSPIPMNSLAYYAGKTQRSTQARGQCPSPDPSPDPSPNPGPNPGPNRGPERGQDRELS